MSNVREQVEKEKLAIVTNRTALGIEFGSTRIKAVLVDDQLKPIASGSFEWENTLADGIWTYSLEEIWKGLQESYRQLTVNVFETYGEHLTSVGAIGFSAMMHGYMAFDQEENLLVPFRTWRNSTTAAAEKILTEAFHYNIPQRWSIAHLYQAILNQESHLEQINYLTTLAGYLHWQLTGEKVLGIGDASGMFPIDSRNKTYDQRKLTIFNDLIAEQVELDLVSILPKVLVAGEAAGHLTEAGARLLDPTGNLKAGIPLCPPEGDAGTGMVATNCISQRSGNVSAGTSAFAMIVLEEELKEVYPEIDLVTTPVGDLVAMVHTNNCTSDINAWMKLFKEVVDELGVDIKMDDLYSSLFKKALEGDADNGGLMSYGYYSGENITGLSEGRPLFVRQPNSRFNLANFMRTHLYSAFGAMRVGMDILKQEGIQIDKIVGHGGIFKTPKVAQGVLAAAMEAPVTVMETAGEGGAWGIAILAAYLINNNEEPLAQYLDMEVFKNSQGSTHAPTAADLASYQTFVARYQAGIAIEAAAVEYLN